MTTKLYVDHLSQPSRSCMLLCRLNPEQLQQTIQECVINIAKGDTRSLSFRSINPIGKVPFLHITDNTNNSLRIPESVAIMKFICETYHLDYWYPKDQRAMIDAVMAWHAGTLRIGSMIVVFNRILAKNLGQQGNEQLVQSYGLPMLRSSLKTLEQTWLANKYCNDDNNSNTFVAGTNKISIADLLLACEIEQLVLLNHDLTMDVLLSECPRVREWMNRVKSVCQPHWNDVHALLYKVVERQNRKNTSRL